MSATNSVLDALMKTIVDRRENPSERSYTTQLLQGGVQKIGMKITEEASEVVEAADETGPDGRQHLVKESADLIYHLFVMLGYRQIELSEVCSELERRFAMSGLEEKASRKKKGQ